MIYIEVIGFMGAGKTSLCQVFNDQTGVATILEHAEDLKGRLYFLEQYLADPAKYGFEGAMNFLARGLNRIQEELARLPEDQRDKCIVADMSMLVQYAYSKPVLSKEELKTVCDIIKHSYAKLPPVDLRIVLTLPPEQHLQRLKDRGRAIEQGITLERLISVQNLVDEAIQVLGGGVPTIYLDASQLDWAHNENDKKAVMDIVREEISRHGEGLKPDFLRGKPLARSAPAPR